MNEFYNPNTYMNPYPQITTPIYRPSNPVSYTQSQNDGLIQVNGIDSARAYPTQPNSRVALFDSNDDVFYVKTTDASNFPTIKRYRFFEESEEQVNNDKYVTIDEFNKFKEEILNGQQSIRSGKSNNGNRNHKQSATNQKYDANDAE